MESTYKVEYADGQEEVWIARAGSAKVTYDNGNTYEGEFNDEKMKHGSGKFTWFDVNEEEETYVKATYDGQYKDGKRHGEGRMTFSNGDSYYGQWIEGKMHGIGTYKYNGGDIYSGSYVAGAKDGKGIYEFGDESRLDGVWDQGSFMTGQWHFKNAGSYTGTFENGQPKGPGKFAFVTQHGIVTQEGEYKVPETTGDPPPEDGDEPPSRTWHGNPVYCA